MAALPKYIYLHGFASGPESAKAQYLRSRFAEISLTLEIPDLNQNDFSNLTISRQIALVKNILNSTSEPVTLIGSSLGGLTAALIAQSELQVQQLILLAPAFQFLSHWLPKLGSEQLQRWQAEKYISVYHHADKRSLPLSYSFLVDAAQYENEQLQRCLPTLILHGIGDEVIPVQASRNFAASRPWVKLIELDSDHALGEALPQIWQAIEAFI